jgi:hypothetical protein
MPRTPEPEKRVSPRGSPQYAELLVGFVVSHLRWSPVRNYVPPGSGAGVPSNGHPYRDSGALIKASTNVQKGDLYHVAGLFAG